MHIKIGETVYRHNDVSQKGKIIAIDTLTERVQVLWEGYPLLDQRYNGNRPKKTWLKLSSLDVIRSNGEI